MTTDIDRIDGRQQTTVSKAQINDLEHNDEDVSGYLAVTDNGMYEVPGNAAEGDIIEEVDAENGYKRHLTYDEDSRTSTSATRVNEDQLNELAAEVECPFAVLDGKVQAREGQSTEAVYDQPSDYGEIDVIE